RRSKAEAKPKSRPSTPATSPSSWASVIRPRLAHRLPHGEAHLHGVAPVGTVELTDELARIGERPVHLAVDAAYDLRPHDLRPSVRQAAVQAGDVGALIRSGDRVDLPHL